MCRDPLCQRNRGMNDQRGAKVSRSWWRLWKLCLAILLLAATAWGLCTWLPQPNTVPMKPTGSRVLRVVTYNVKCNTPSADTIELLRELDADIILLQEVRRDEDGIEGARPAAIKQALGLNGYYAVSYDGGRRTEGQMILSRYPIREGESFDLPNRRGIAVAATIDVNGWPIRVYSVHLTWPLQPAPPGNRRREAERIARRIDSDLADSLPVIVGADLNASPNSGPYEAFSSLLTDCASAVGRARATLPKGVPLLRYDMVFVSDHFTPLTAGAKPGPSDHLAVIVDIELSDAPP